MKIFSPFEWLGEKAAGADISESSKQAIALRLKLKEESQKTQIPELDAGGVAVGLVTNLTNGVAPLDGVFAGAVPNPFSAVVSFGQGVGTIQDEHKAYIEDMILHTGEKAFNYQSVSINGKKVEVWVDASGALQGDNTPTIYMEGHEAALGNPEDKSSYRNNKALLKEAVTKIGDEAVAMVNEEMRVALEEMRFGKKPAQAYSHTLSGGDSLKVEGNPTLPVTGNTTLPTILNDADHAAAAVKGAVSPGSTVQETASFCTPNAKGVCISSSYIK